MTTPLAPVEALPKLYIYDHSTYSVRATMIFGLKDVAHKLIFLANHDETTPIYLVGTKQAPILELSSGKAFPDSFDIVRYVDENFGGPKMLKEASGREDLKEWIQKASKSMHPPLAPRNLRAPFPEFAMHASREYFTKKKEAMYGSFDDLHSKTPELIAELNQPLNELNGLIYSDELVNVDGVGYDDITCLACYVASR